MCARSQSRWTAACGSLNGVDQALGVAFSCDATTGAVTFAAAPPAGAAVTAGFAFDVPVRFDTDFLELDHSGFEAGEIANIPIVEIKA